MNLNEENESIPRKRGQKTKETGTTEAAPEPQVEPVRQDPALPAGATPLCRAIAEVVLAGETSVAGVAKTLNDDLPTFRRRLKSLRAEEQACLKAIGFQL